MKVAKFGGSSLADAERIGAVCDIVVSDDDRKIVVVSAPGKRTGDDIKVTDLLIAAADDFLAGKAPDEAIAPVVARFDAIAADLGLPAEVIERIKADLSARLQVSTENKGMFIDQMKAAGEDNSAWLVAAVFQSRGVNASYVSPAEAGLLLSSEYGAARVLPESYRNLKDALVDHDGIVVFPGFYGVTPEGDTVTFPRGGSDITGAVLAAAVEAEMYENFTDVDSVFAVDPRIVADAHPITEMTYREMRELAYAGFSVFHDEAIAPAVDANVPICIRNTGRPNGEGTMIVPEREHVPGHAIGVAGEAGFCTIYVSKYLMNRELGFGRKLLQILEEEGISYEHTPSGIDNMSIVLSEESLTEEREDHVCRRIANELDAEVGVERGLALVMIVGEGMHFAVGLAAKATTALAEASVNIEMMNQGSSEISMMFGVKAEQREAAVGAIYRALFSKN